MRFLSILFLLLGQTTQAPAQSTFDIDQIAWDLTPAADGKSVAMRMHLTGLFQRDRLVLRIPLWRPGSYRYDNYQDNLSDLQAVDQDGEIRGLLGLDPRTWEVQTTGATALTVTYTLSTKNHAAEGALPAVHLRGPSTFLYTEDTKGFPHTLKVNLPPEWDFASGHRADERTKELLRSPNYDVFVDCPMALGDLERHTFVSHGKKIEWVMLGRPLSEIDFPRLDWGRKLEAMCHVAHEIFGDYPFEKYTFLFLFTPGGGISGLEHLNSTSIISNHSGFSSGRLMDPLESVTAHEFFHTWNVKRIRPKALGPFDYSSDVRTKDLWWLEGLTSYYNDIILQRAGLRADGWFWKAQAKNYLDLQRAGGFGKVSPERASWTEWEPNRSEYISYYTSGQTLGLLLDLKIRTETQNRRSLDDVMAFLARWVNYPEEGYRPGDLERAVRAVTGWNCTEFFDRHVEGLVRPPFADILPPAGLAVTDISADAPYLGLSFQDELTMSVKEGRHSFEAGLRSGDVLQAVRGISVSDQAHALKIFRTLQPDTTCTFQILRAGEILDIEIPVNRRGLPVFRITPDEAASPQAIEIREGVLTGTPDAI
ncbi:MAG: PDZ domain-containing protein [Planctomycetota bacterium]|nr:PDZ domain-containing protein [Planctomycetota bacterium]